MSRAGQRGVALITILIIVALVALIATTMASNVYLQMNRTGNQLDADQAQEYARGAEEFAIQILKKSFEKDGGDRVHLKQPWAVKGMAFPIDGGVLTGEITDLKACFNLNSLLAAPAAGDGKNPAPPPQPGQGEDMGSIGQALNPGQKVFRSLIRQLSLDTETSADNLMEALTDWIDPDQNPFGPGGAEDVNYTGLAIPYRTADQPLASITELRAIQGFTPKVYDRLRPYVCVLPDVDSFAINVNTVPEDRPELLMMMFKDNTLTAGNAREFLQKRGDKGYDQAQIDSSSLLPPKEQRRVPNGLVAKSDYFQITARAVVGQGEARLVSIVKKDGNTYRVLARSFGEEEQNE